MSIPPVDILPQALCGIREIQDIREVTPQLQDLASSDDLVLFDIDYTCTRPEHLDQDFMALQQGNEGLFSQGLAQLKKEEQELLPILLHVPNRLIDDAVPGVVDGLKGRGVRVLGFTAVDTSVAPDGGEVPSWRHDELQRLGIVFSSVMGKQRVEFAEFPSFRGTYPLYDRGILYTNVHPSKGDVLSVFLKTIPFKPRRVFMIDDSRKNLEGAQKVLERQNIPFLGLHYAPVTKPSIERVTPQEWASMWDTIRVRASMAKVPRGILETAHTAAIRWAVKEASQNTLVVVDEKVPTSELLREVPDRVYTVWRHPAGENPVLQELLANRAAKPKAIVFAGVARENCEQIAKEGAEIDIPALCIHYTGAS